METADRPSASARAIAAAAISARLCVGCGPRALRSGRSQISSGVAAAGGCAGVLDDTSDHLRSSLLDRYTPRGRALDKYTVRSYAEGNATLRTMYLVKGDHERIHP